MKDINAMILDALHSPPKMKEEAEQMEKDITYLHREYSGYINEKTFIKIIQKAERNEKTTRFLAGLVASAYPCEVTNTIFSLLIELKGDYRYTILSCLAHLPLAYYQLVILNNLRVEEALFQLIDLYIHYDCFTEYDLNRIFLPWNNRLDTYIRNSIEYLLLQQESPKNEVVRRKIEGSL